MKKLLTILCFVSLAGCNQNVGNERQPGSPLDGRWAVGWWASCNGGNSNVYFMKGNRWDLRGLDGKFRQIGRNVTYSFNRSQKTVDVSYEVNWSALNSQSPNEFEPVIHRFEDEGTKLVITGVGLPSTNVVVDLEDMDMQSPVTLYYCGVIES